MAKQINKNWALIERAGYTIQRTLHGNFPAERYEAITLRDSVAWQVSNASGWDACVCLPLILDACLTQSNAGTDLNKQTLRAVITAKKIGFGKLDAAQWLAAKHCSACGDCHGYLCIACAKAIITPALARECNGEAAWAAARNGGKLDAAMATMIENTPALRAERERRALAALIPATPTATHRQGGRL